MELTDFIHENIPDGSNNKDYLRYTYLRGILKNNQEISSIENGTELFQEFLELKDKLFTIALNNWLDKRT